MALLGILFNQNRTVINAKDSGLTGFLGGLQGVLRDTIGGVAGIVVDATVNEEHTSSCDVTENPVEDGANITDHVRLKPAELVIEGVISDTPLGYAVIGNIQNTIRTVSSLFGRKSRSVDAYNDLLNLQKSRQPCTVVTGLRRYKSMILAELSVPRNADTGAAIHFRATFKEIQIVSSKTAGVNMSASVKKIAGPTNDNGKKITDPVLQGDIVNPDSTSRPSTGARTIQTWFHL